MSEGSAELAGVRPTLADHFVMWHDMGGPGQPPGEWRCWCGLKFGFSDTALDHVAAEVERIVAARLAEAWTEGVRFGQTHWATNYAGVYQNGLPLREAPNPYRLPPAPPTPDAAA